MTKFSWIALTAALALAGCQNQNGDGSDAGGWIEFAPPGLHFKVDLPSEPTEVQLPEQQKQGTFLTQVYELNPEAEAAGPRYKIRYDDYPPQVFALLQGGSNVLLARSKMIEHGIEGIIILSEDSSNDDGHLIKDFTIEHEDGAISVYRVVLVRTEMVELGVSVPRGQEESEAVTRFLNSFQYLPDTAPEAEAAS